jgi:serine/threonine protein kinase
MTTATVPVTFAEAVALLAAARTAEEVFRPDGAHAYRRLAKLVHPDRAGAEHGEAAAAAFAKLAALWEAYHRGTTTITTGRRSYVVGARVVAGDIANLYHVRYDGKDALLKLARNPANNDLIEREAAALRVLAASGDRRHRAYVPRLVEHIRYREAGTGVQRVANVIDRLDGFVSLADVRRAFPDGLDPRDVAWMWRRLLVALGFAHRAGVVHGAVLPDHVLIRPADHGLVLIDWCYATTETGDTVPAMVGRYAQDYPPEIPARRPVTPAADIHMATRCMSTLIDSGTPRRMEMFIRGCTLASPAARPKDAWRLLAELDGMLETLYGPRKFRPFHMPQET